MGDRQVISCTAGLHRNKKRIRQAIPLRTLKKTGAGPGYQKEYKIRSCHVPEIVESQTPAEIGISVVGIGENEQEQEKEQKAGEMDQQLGQKRAPALQISSSGHDPCGFGYFLFLSAAEGGERDDGKNSEEVKGKSRNRI